jgi:hypothetical protein
VRKERLSFTWSKIMQQTGYLQNQDDWAKLYRQQGNEPSKLLNLSATYQIPLFAKRKGIVGNLLGGWQASAVMRYSNGYLIGVPGATTAYSSGVNPKLDNPTYQHWFNTCSLNTAGARQNCASAGDPVAFLQLPPFTLGTLGGYLPGIRTEIPVFVDFALFKTFSIRESLKAQFRANAYNLGNTPQFGGPNTSFGSANFGVVTLSQLNDPRVVELALKIIF